MRTFARRFAAAGIGAVLCASVSPGFGADQEVSCTGLGYGPRRVLEHSFQGVDALRRYVLITRPVHHVSMVDVVESLDEWRAKAQCTVKTAAGAPAPAATALAQLAH